MANYYFAADLRIPTAETIGPKTNSRSVNLLHPDMCQSDPDLGRTRVMQRAVDRSTWLPNALNNNKVMLNAYELDADGDAVARPIIKPDGSLDSKVYYAETDVVEGAYMADAYGHTSQGVAVQPEANKVLFWTVI